MLRILTIIVITSAILIGSYFFFIDRPTEIGNVPGESQKTIESKDFGFLLMYRDGPDAYTVVVPREASRGDLVYALTLFNTSEYQEFQHSTESREGPPGISIEIFRNPMNLDAAAWVRTHQRSNFNLAVGDALVSTRVGNTTFETYEWDGLYRADAFAHAREGYVYLFTVTYGDAASPMRDDLRAMLGTLVWSTPTLPASVAHGDIRVAAPEVGARVASPLMVRGEARGYWFFEASFPLVLVDWDGKIIAQSYATAQGEWMTEEFVPFEGEIVFEKPAYGERGTLILQKDNPSGLPEHDDAIEIPVVFD